ncbi:hypothetical protein TorRG33x02_049360 [Trema orientale]|uniref:RNase H type-1 domain-containing protein n=1 Tax=Trema orientale TaxID=63057 RepID=A0A2P5FNT1_TREOI|nr:hypothetical protein TorRG33x02_049360 [Trema orientale]
MGRAKRAGLTLFTTDRAGLGRGPNPNFPFGPNEPGRAACIYSSIRDHEGKVFVYFLKHFRGSFSIANAERMAIREAFSSVDQHRWKIDELESNSRAIECVTSQQPLTHNANIISNISNLLLQVNCGSCRHVTRHVTRESNKVAHLLVKGALD